MSAAGIRGLALVGMPGGGKSTVGRQLAKRLGWTFADSDVLIEKRLGSSIRAFFEREGEKAFREIESTVIDELTKSQGLVIATGGGALLRADSRERLHQRYRVVYLHSSPEELFRRLRHDSSRPLLQVADPLAKLRELYQERDPLYRQVAHFTVETGRPSVGALVNNVLMQLELAGEIDPGLALSPVDPFIPSREG
ncbi:shikimate kinase [Piscinibacter gummiphilus]|uniref:Shikimate kinase n=1 Tax=Piscinibacter gummiphilus TaxID=946333 RepID=A0ABZ0CWD9_9BURK|nr:shikimate kinase [Piscinibacter gummiphilus]WOB09294.1 shikimate kinase [Piscinibacter gummiphilus]